MESRTRIGEFLSTVSIAVLLIIFLLGLLALDLYAGTDQNSKKDPSWTIYYRPAVRFGSDDRTLYINDFLIPIYQDEKNIFFNNTKFTPNDQDGWEVNLGLGYRRLLLDDRLILGVNAFYDQRKMSWGTIYEQWGVGAEGMADIPFSLNTKKPTLSSTLAYGDNNTNHGY